MLVFMFGCLIAIAYFVFKLARIHTQSAKYADSRYYLSFFCKYDLKVSCTLIIFFSTLTPSFSLQFFLFLLIAALTLLCVLLTLANAIVCFANFNKGLKQHCKRQKFSFLLSKANSSSSPSFHFCLLFLRICSVT